MTMTAAVAPSVDDDATGAVVDVAEKAPPSALRFALLVGAAVVVGLALRIAIGLTDDAPSTDETAYLRSGVSIAEGDGFVRAPGRPELHFPPFVPFLMGMAHKVFDDPHTGAVVLTCLSGTALILPLALLARQAAGPVAGMVTAWVAALTPGLSTTFVTGGAGSEAEYTLLLVSAVWAVVSASGRTGVARLWRVAASGLLVGLAFLTRPEGLFIALPLLLAVVVPLVRRRRPRADDGEAAPARNGEAAEATEGVAGAAADAEPGIVRRLVGTAPLVAGFLVPLAACVVPYAMFLHTHTGQWQLSAKTQDVSIEAWRAVADGDREARDKELYALDETGFELPTERSSLPSLAREDPKGYAGILGTNVLALGDNLTRTSREPYTWTLLPLPLWGLAVLGAWRLRRSRTVALLVAVGALPVATALAFFVQPRYLVVAVAPAVVFVGIAVASMSDKWRRPVVAGSLALLAVSSVFAFRGGPGWGHPSDHLSQRRVGEWIAANTDADDRVISRSMVVEYYSQRPTVAIPYATYDEIMSYARHYGVSYLVLDPSTEHRLRPQLAFLGDVDEAPGLRLVHESRVEGTSTRVFELDPPPLPGAPLGPGLGFVGDSGG